MVLTVRSSIRSVLQANTVRTLPFPPLLKPQLTAKHISIHTQFLTRWKSATKIQFTKNKSFKIAELLDVRIFFFLHFYELRSGENLRAFRYRPWLECDHHVYSFLIISASVMYLFWVYMFYSLSFRAFFFLSPYILYFLTPSYTVLFSLLPISSILIYLSLLS